MEDKKVYPMFRIDLDHLPEAKKWEVGETYKVELHLKQVGISQSRFQNDVEFEVIGINPKGENPKKKDY